MFSCNHKKVRLKECIFTGSFPKASSSPECRLVKINSWVLWLRTWSRIGIARGIECQDAFINLKKNSCKSPGRVTLFMFAWNNCHLVKIIEDAFKCIRVLWPFAQKWCFNIKKERRRPCVDRKCMYVCIYNKRECRVEPKGVQHRWRWDQPWFLASEHWVIN